MDYRSSPGAFLWGLRSRPFVKEPLEIESTRYGENDNRGEEICAPVS